MSPEGHEGTCLRDGNTLYLNCGDFPTIFFKTYGTIYLQRTNFVYVNYTFQKNLRLLSCPELNPQFLYCFSSPCGLFRCLRNGLREAGWPTPLYTLVTPFSDSRLPQKILFRECKEKMKCDSIDSISQLLVVEGTVPGPAQLLGLLRVPPPPSPVLRPFPPPKAPAASFCSHTSSVSAFIQQCKQQSWL